MTALVIMIIKRSWTVMEITKENFTEVAHVICSGITKAENYNSTCLRMNEIKLAQYSRIFLERFVASIEKSGYNPFIILEPIMKVYGHYLLGEEKRYYKSELDEEFSMQLDDFQSLYAYFKYLYQSNAS